MQQSIDQQKVYQKVHEIVNNKLMMVVVVLLELKLLLFCRCTTAELSVHLSHCEQFQAFALITSCGVDAVGM